MELSWLDACEDRQVLRWFRKQVSNGNAQIIIKNAINEASMRTTTSNWCAVLSCGVGQGKSRDVQRLGNCTPSGSRKSPQQHDSSGELFAQSLELVSENKRPVQFYPKIRWDWTVCQKVAIVVNIKLTFGLSVVKMKSRRHRFRIAELQFPSL